jgi:hypothetical protein
MTDRWLFLPTGLYAYPAGLDPQHDADRLRPWIGSRLQDSGLPDRIRMDEAISLFAGPRATGGDRALVATAAIAAVGVVLACQRSGL